MELTPKFTIYLTLISVKIGKPVHIYLSFMYSNIVLLGLPIMIGSLPAAVCTALTLTPDPGIITPENTVARFNCKKLVLSNYKNEKSLVHN